MRETRGFEINVGLHKGSALSPAQFNDVTDVLTEIQGKWQHGACCMLMML